MSAWQDISTAPVDGEAILLFSPDAYEPSIFVGRWLDFHGPTGGIEESHWVDVWTESVSDADPTHWMPLPDAPVQP